MDPKRLRELLHYDPKTGIFTWKVTINNKTRAGAAAGCRDGHAYHLIGVDGRLYVAHRLAWLWMTGAWPEADIDHRNLDKKDNRWSNLRAATRSGNMANTGARADNTSGLKGVTWDKHRNKWLAQIRVNGKNKFLGRFECLEAAHAAYVAKAKEMFGEFARAA
ncbi:MAG: HNH endonuclease [Hyphomicrobiales bacterium]|nr:HNH endonuclease [Hyphomicrobiales bacterium]